LSKPHGIILTATDFTVSVLYAQVALCAAIMGRNTTRPTLLSFTLLHDI